MNLIISTKQGEEIEHYDVNIALFIVVIPHKLLIQQNLDPVNMNNCKTCLIKAKYKLLFSDSCHYFLSIVLIDMFRVITTIP